jgi:hypothetical protein
VFIKFNQKVHPQKRRKHGKQVQQLQLRSRLLKVQDVEDEA